MYLEGLTICRGGIKFERLMYYSKLSLIIILLNIKRLQK